MKRPNESFRIALAVQEAGAFAVVLECVPAGLASEITQTLHIPTIGIGAGVDCDGQVLVTQDMLGQYCDYGPKFVRRFAQVVIRCAQHSMPTMKPSKAESFRRKKRLFPEDSRF